MKEHKIWKRSSRGEVIRELEKSVSIEVWQKKTQMSHNTITVIHVAQGVYVHSVCNNHYSYTDIYKQKIYL